MGILNTVFVRIVTCTRCYSMQWFLGHYTVPAVHSLGDSILSHRAILTTLAILKSIVGLNFNILQACTLI